MITMALEIRRGRSIAAAERTSILSFRLSSILESRLQEHLLGTVMILDSRRHAERMHNE